MPMRSEHLGYENRAVHQFIERRPHGFAGIAFKPNTESILPHRSLYLGWGRKIGTQIQSFILTAVRAYYRESRYAAFSPDGTVAIADRC